MPSISTPTLAPPNDAEAGRQAGSGAALEGRAALPQRGHVERDRRARRPSSPGVSSARSPAIVAWIAAAPSVASRNAARTAAAVSAWIRWLTSGQARAGSIRSISSWSSRWSARIRAWNANPVRVRRAANSSSRRTDQEASAAARVARRPRTSRRSVVSALGGGRVVERRRPRPPATRAAGRGRAGPGRRPSRATPPRARPTTSSASAVGEARVAALRLEARVAGGEPVRAQHRAERERRVGQAHRGQAALVDRDDPPPFGVDVDLGDRDQDRRAGAHGAGEEGQLGRGQLGRGIGHEHERVGRRQEGQGRGRVGGVQPADAGRVDERDPPLEERVGQADLDDLDAVAPVVAIALRDPATGLVGRDRLDDQLAALPPPDDRARRRARSGRRSRPSSRGRRRPGRPARRAGR